MYINFSTFAEDGAMDGSSFALEIRTINFYGIVDDGMLVDLTHMDGEKERIKVEGKPYGNFKIGPHERIMAFQIVDYPHTSIVTKDEFHRRVGTGRFLNANGHFA